MVAEKGDNFFIWITVPNFLLDPDKGRFSAPCRHREVRIMHSNKHKSIFCGGPPGPARRLRLRSTQHADFKFIELTFLNCSWPMIDARSDESFKLPMPRIPSESVGLLI